MNRDNKHIESVGRELFAKAANAAFLETYKDDRLTAAPHIRFEIAHEAAMRATGATHKRPSVPSSKRGPATMDVDDTMGKCVAAATAVLPKKDDAE